MRKANQRSLNSGIYARVREVQMSAADREMAIKALHGAEQFADAILWIKDRFVALGQVFMKPSLKH
jgi:hypothetical protein